MQEASEIFSQTLQRSTSTVSKDSNPMVVPLPEKTACELRAQLSLAMQIACGAAQKLIVDIISLRNRLPLIESSSSTTLPGSMSSETLVRNSDGLTKAVATGESVLNRLSSEEFVRLVNLLQDFQASYLRFFNVIDG